MNLTNGQKQSARFPDKSYCVKGRGYEWYQRLLKVSKITKNASFLKYIRQQMDDLESRHIHLSPHQRIDIGNLYLEESKIKLAKTPYIINSRDNAVKIKKDLHDTRINDKVDSIAIEIRKGLKIKNDYN